MSEPVKAAKQAAAPSKKFSQMGFVGQCTHVVKIAVFVLTAGFAFANILDD